ncbi:MAG TPA: hypothetical protein P5110_07510 [Candidatus Omnitrophota bacterium]|nr:hypothetical protein [Candidatus Omnitrophota bacterium]
MNQQQGPQHKICIIQARSTSTRFPNKALTPITQFPVLQHVIDSAFFASVFTHVFVAVPKGDPIGPWCTERKISWFEGDENDVLRRYYMCVQQRVLPLLPPQDLFRPISICRITGDCPLVPTELIVYLNLIAGASGIDYVSNVIYRSYPDGWDVEVLSWRLLKWLHENVKDPENREHVTSYIIKNLDKIHKAGFSFMNVACPVDLSGVKVSVDTPEDLEKVRAEFTRNQNETRKIQEIIKQSK